jgi:hypothetical protein
MVFNETIRAMQCKYANTPFPFLHNMVLRVLLSLDILIELILKIRLMSITIVHTSILSEISNRSSLDYSH